MSIRRQEWGTMPDGRSVDLFTLSNEQGVEMSIATYGGTVTRLIVPDRDGVFGDVVLGYDTLEQYLADECCFGCIIGRVANRIGDARFVLDGVECDLDRNHGNHHLHGGSGGFHTRVWTGEAFDGDAPQVRLSLESPDGDQGYPGKLSVTAVYTLLDDGLRMEFQAETDRTTPLAMTNHTYFNLAGHAAGDCLDHEVVIPASRFLVTDQDQIPTGEIASVEGTPLDFREIANVGSRIEDSCDSLEIGRGYDAFFVLDDATARERLAATVSERSSGRVLEVRTDQPGVQFYSGNHMPRSLKGKDGLEYGHRGGLCVEPQGYPNAPNRPEFPSVMLEPGTPYKMTIAYHFPRKWDMQREK